MSTEYGLYQATVHSVGDGVTYVRIPAVAGRDIVGIATPADTSGFVAPAVGQSIMVAVNHDKTKVVWVLGPPTAVQYETVADLSASVAALDDVVTELIGGGVAEAKVNRSGDTMSGTLTTTRLRLTATDDASPTSTLHALQVGPDAGVNLIIDNNEILARNNGAGSTLFLGASGPVEIGGQPLMPAGVSTVGTWTNGTDWSAVLFQVRRIGPLAFIYGTATRTGAAITVSANGDIGNTLVATCTAGVALGNVAYNQPLMAHATGRMCNFVYNPSSGALYLTSLAPGANIATNDQLGFCGLVVVDGT